jgi:hypothetical protein
MLLKVFFDLHFDAIPRVVWMYKKILDMAVHIGIGKVRYIHSPFWSTFPLAFVVQNQDLMVRVQSRIYSSKGCMWL